MAKSSSGNNKESIKVRECPAGFITSDPLDDDSNKELVEKYEKGTARIILRASLITGSISSAVEWFECRPIPGFGNKTPAEVVAGGDPGAVLQHLNDVNEGTFT